MSGPASSCFFTVVTATYNRATTLDRVYGSLCAQTMREFEWLVVDDGSADDTGRRVEQWAREAQFSVRYLWQENQGKHVAFNRAVREAHGELIVVLDSDDACVPQALARFRDHWETIPPADRPSFAGVAALCIDQHGHRIGDPFPQDVLDSNALELRYRYKVRGEKWGCNRTDVLRRFPFPERPRRTYVPESIVWNRIAREYRTRYVNEELRVYWLEGPSLVHGQVPARNAPGGRIEHKAVLDSELEWFRFAPLQFVRSALHYARYSFHIGIGLRAQWNGLSRVPARILWLLALLPAFVIYRLDPR
jgi:glycosyltransferase involved in cell wall biosynthesis